MRFAYNQDVIPRKSRISKHQNKQAALGSLLRDLRLQANLKQTDLAERLNLPQSYVSKYEAGERSLDIFELREIGICLGVSFETLIRLLEQRLTRDES